MVQLKPGPIVMSTSSVVVSFLVFCGGALLVHLLSILIVILRQRYGAPGMAVVVSPPVSILRPICGLENNIADTLETTFVLDYPSYEIIFCVASATDPAIPLVQRLMASYPLQPAQLLIGSERFSANPKLDNLVKGWQAACHEWIIMADSNVLLPHDYVQLLFSCWTAGTGLVTSPPVGSKPEGFWAELECAFLNTHQARWQLVADGLGFGFAQGKTMLWRRDILENAGGIGALAAETAEDAAATKIVRRAGLKVRVARQPFAQPVGKRQFRDVWSRQVRWGRLRRATFKAFFIPELLSGGLFPSLVVWSMVSGGHVPVSAALAFSFVWYSTEAALARSAGWPCSAASILALMVRDVMLPVLWVSGWTGSRFVWRGTPMIAVENYGR